MSKRRWVFRSSPIRELQHGFGLSRPLYGDLGHRFIDFAKVVCGEREVRSPEVFLEAVEPLCAWNRDDPRFLREQPCEREVCRRRSLPRRDAFQHLNECQVGGARLRREPRGRVPKAAGIECRVRVDLAGQESRAERTPRDEADSEFLTRVQHRVLLDVARPQRILTLNRRDREDRVRAPDRLCCRFRESVVLDLALLVQVLQDSGDVLDRHVGIDTLLIKEIDRLGFQPGQHRIHDFANVIWTAIQATTEASAPIANAPTATAPKAAPSVARPPS